MPYTNDRGLFGAALVLLPLVIVFIFAYHNSATSIVKPYQIFKNKFYNQNPLHQDQTRAPANQGHTDLVHLQKNEKVYINKACLVFTGLSQGIVNLELTLLELDRDIAYPVTITKESFSKGIWLSNVQYQFVSVKKDTLHLRILNLN